MSWIISHSPEMILTYKLKKVAMMLFTENKKTSVGKNTGIQIVELILGFISKIRKLAAAIRKQKLSECVIPMLPSGHMPKNLLDSYDNMDFYSNPVTIRKEISNKKTFDSMFIQRFGDYKQ